MRPDTLYQLSKARRLPTYSATGLLRCPLTPRRGKQPGPVSFLTIEGMRARYPSPVQEISFPTVILQASRLVATTYLRAIGQEILLEDSRNYVDAKPGHFIE